MIQDAPRKAKRLHLHYAVIDYATHLDVIQVAALDVNS